MNQTFKTIYTQSPFREKEDFRGLKNIVNERKHVNLLRTDFSFCKLLN